MSVPPSDTNSGGASSATGSVTCLFARLRGCDPAGLAEVWRRFFPRMAGLARRTLAGLPSQAVDADDVAQSAFISFWRALDRGAGITLTGRDDLWRLLATITARKAYRSARRQAARKRGGGRTLRESDLAAHEPSQAPLENILAQIAPPDLDLVCEEMLATLDDDERAIVILRLQEFSTEEIAQRLGCSSRTVQRKLEAVRRRWEPEREGL